MSLIDLTGRVEGIGRQATQQLQAYLQLLERWNQTYNLTAIHDLQQMVTLHVADSLAIGDYLVGEQIVDIGTGAGLPGIPLALQHPDKHFTLLDSAGKKVRFLRHVKRQLGLVNIQPLQVRIEEYAPSRPPDIMLARAVASLATLAAWVAPLFTAHNQLLVMKGRYPGQELDELPEWATVRTVESIQVPGLEQERHLVVINRKQE